MTYTQDNLRQLFQNQFDIHIWQDMLRDFFHATELKQTPEYIEGSSDNTENGGYYLGALDDNNAYRIGFFLYKISGNVSRKRVGLRALVRQFTNPQYGMFDAALVVFDDGRHWRLSYICDIKGETTAPKRYTYVFGDEHNGYRTPVDRFVDLQKNGISHETMLKAFSVEALSDDFFKGFNIFYADFVEEITGTRFCKDANKMVEKKVSEPSVYFRTAFHGTDQNDTIAKKTVRDFVKKMQGRIVFLHYLQKKGWLGGTDANHYADGDRQFLQHLFEKQTDEVKENFLEEVLEPLFFGVLNTPKEYRQKFFAEHGYNTNLLCEYANIPYLNGGLFEDDSQDREKVCFKASSWEHFFDFLSQYNFTIDENDPDDMEVGVDPEMLGRIFESQLEDNKEKGAFYTPKEIVQYMCSQSLQEYLKTECPNVLTDDIKNLVEQHIAPECNKEPLLMALQEVKVCDPAIGSGAFPMGMLNLLHACRVALGETNGEKTIRHQIIENNIYGVDIERGAIDIARLRFWLALIVEEEKPRPLPNFDYKFMQGNSLLEYYKGIDLSELLIDSYDATLGCRLVFAEETSSKALLSEKLTRFFQETDHRSKEELRIDIHKAILQLVRAKHQGGNMQAIADEIEDLGVQNDKFFLWHTWFDDVFNRPSDSNKSGFDIVIGNPPYGAKLSESDKKIVKQQYTTAKTIKSVQKGSLDTFTLFIELGYNLLRHNGSFAYIVPLSLTSSDALTGVHRLLMKNCENIYISSYAVRPKPVFENAVVNTAILLFKKTETPCKHLYSTKMHRRGNEFDLQKLIDNLQFVDVKAQILYGRIPKIGSEIEKTILNKLFNHTKLGSLIKTSGSPIIYRFAGGRYFKVVTNYSVGSSAERTIYFANSKIADAVGCILSSNLAFWFYQIFSDNLNWKKYEIENFTIPQLSTKDIEYLDKLYSRYLADIEAKANIRTTSGESTYNVDTFKEYKIVRSKAIIDEIDDYLCPLYGLTQEETDFIKSYELEFRMAGDN